MSTFVLVHGSWHAAWCWHKIVPRLERAGHTAIAVDLPGHGRDHTPTRAIGLHSYVDRLAGVLDAQSEPVILVGHSRSGIAIAQTAEARPEKVRELVFLAAFLVGDGKSVHDWARQDRDSLVLPQLQVNREQGWDWLPESRQRAALYADCHDDDVALTRLLLAPEPAALAATPLRLSEGRFGRVPRIYIELLADRAVSPSLQRAMHTRLPCARVLSLPTSHSAYFSAPDLLAGHLCEIAGTAR